MVTKVTPPVADIASQAEAEAGTATDKFMTPQRVSQAIAALQRAVREDGTRAVFTDEIAGYDDKPETWCACPHDEEGIRDCIDTGGGGGFWTDMNDGTPDRLLSYRTYEASAMDDAQDIDAAATANNRILIVGDGKRFVIVDRVGMRVERIPHLFHTGNNRPSGQRGLFAFGRTGADSIDDNGFRMLNVDTTA